MFGLRRRQPQKPATPRIPFPAGYNLEEFRSNEGLVNMAIEWRRSALGGHMMAVMYNGLPSGYPMRGEQVNPTAAAIELGRVQGYMDCINLLQVICTKPPSVAEIPQDYQAEQILKDEGLEFKE